MDEAETELSAKETKGRTVFTQVALVLGTSLTCPQNVSLLHTLCQLCCQSCPYPKRSARRRWCGRCMNRAEGEAP